MTSAPVPAAAQLAAWALDLRLKDVGPAVLEKVKLHVLDQVGAQVSCRDLPTCRVTQDYVTRYGVPGRAPVLGTGLRLDPEYAGFANGTAGSSFEIDDYGGAGANCHPGCAVVPGVFAIGEASDASGESALLASAVGFETVIRLALSTKSSLFVERGFHHTSTFGGFAVALATCMLEGDGLETAINAVAIAGSHAGGTTEFTRSGGEVKRVHAGMAVAGGIRSARLARSGVTGPPTIFEGKRGFLQAFCNDFDPGPITDGLGERWFFPERGALKLYASCALVQPHFAAYDKIKAAHGVGPDEIEEIRLGCDPITLVHTGGIGPRPTTVLGAQFSAEYGIAMRVVKGRNDVGTYLDLEAAQFADPAIYAVADRVRLARDPDCTVENLLGRVTLRMKDGRTLTETAFAPGSPANPVSREAVEQKYLGLVSRDFGDDVARRSLDLVMNLEEVRRLDEITGLFVPRRH